MQGATFIILLPALTEQAVPGVEEAARTEADPAHRSATILIAEDDGAIRLMLTETLTAHGHQVLDAEDGLAALKLAMRQASPIDLLITDIMMPRMNGRELARQLGEIMPGTKVLFISGCSGDIIASADISDRGMHFLQKPFRMLDLERKVREVLDS